ncbi:MAG: hypothetical protein KatS3mg115_0841 [Candidatus Poribacteria bacterium]|nr:MAG: hypothetical protein KatS3mg115_0841 [Candidatus Poribacteria bacterium]
MRGWIFVLLLLGGVVGGGFGQEGIPGPLGDGRLDALIAQAERDPELAPYPHFREHIVTVLRRKALETRPLQVNPYVAELLGGNGQPAVEMHREDVVEFFRACAEDGLTIIRAIGLVGRTVAQTGVLIYLDGRHAVYAVESLGLNLGLAMPLEGLELFAYLPLPDRKPASDVQSGFLAVYRYPYEHRFPKEILNATLKIGTGRSAPYLSPWDPDDSLRIVYLVEGKLIYGRSGVGFVDVEGIGGRKGGLLGTLQKIFFFLPDAIDAMVVRDGALHVQAIVSQRVANFESLPVYAVHYEEGVWTNLPASRP